MTYKEIKDRLTKCEFTLTSIKNGTYTPKKNIPVKDTENQLQLLKENLTKQLAEAEKTAFVNNTAIEYDDEEELKKLKNNSDVDTIKTASGKNIKEDIKFSLDETKAIAKKVGQAVAKALKDSGDDIAHMKATHIEENSFDIEVVYKNNSDDAFSFHMINDTLHLADFSFDKGLVDVGVKPSGEPIIQVDVLANELMKHFKSMNEASFYESDSDKIDAVIKKTSDVTNLTVDQLGERLHNYLESGDQGSDQIVAAMLKQMYKFTEAKVILKHLEGHKSDSLPVHEGPHQTTYIKVSKSDYKKAMQVMDQNLDGEYVSTDIVDDDGDGNVIVYFNFTSATTNHDRYNPDSDPAEFIYDLSMDLEANGISVVDASHDLDEIKEKKGKDHDGDDEQHYIKVASKDVKEVLAYCEEYLNGNYSFNGTDTFFVPDEKDAIDTIIDLKGDKIKILGTNISGFIKETEGEKDMEEPDIDIGHVDDEPDMLQNTAYETSQYAAKLVKKLQKYNQHDGEVDFPNWWQSKLILAREYISSAFHYLDSKEKQPALDQLALEGHGMTTKIKPSKGDPTNMAYTDKVDEGRGDMDIITNLISDKAAESGFSEKEEAMEVMEAIGEHYGINFEYGRVGDNLEENEDRFVRAAFEDLEQVVRNLAHTANISEDEALEMAIRKLEAMLDGRDDLDENSVDKIYQGLAQVKKHIKTHLEMYNDAESPKNKQLAVNMLKKLNAQKKELEKHLEDKVSGIGKDQTLDSNSLLDMDEAGPGFAHDCAAKVVHEKYGKGNCIPEKHTLVKEGSKYVVTHYDVLFENGNTVLDIPVNELDIKTSNEHWHKGYKKKKK